MSGLKLSQRAFMVTKDILGMCPFAEQTGEGSTSRTAVMGKLGLLPQSAQARTMGKGPRNSYS